MRDFSALACGGGDRNNDGYNSTKPVDSTLTSCIRTTGYQYESLLCPRNSSDPAYYPVEMEAPVTILDRMNDAVARVPIGFPFTFYGMTFTHLNASSNGLLQFGEGSTHTGVTTALSSLSASLNNWPVIAPLW